MPWVIMIDTPIEIEYNCHTEYGNPCYTSYAYIPVIAG